jgi:hypothetical protein
MHCYFKTVRDASLKVIIKMYIKLTDVCVMRWWWCAVRHKGYGDVVQSSIKDMTYLLPYRTWRILQHRSLLLRVLAKRTRRGTSPCPHNYVPLYRLSIFFESTGSTSPPVLWDLCDLFYYMIYQKNWVE